MTGMYVMNSSGVLEQATLVPGTSESTILDSKSYYPDTAITYTPGTSMSDLDATNASVTFTTPASGVVYVRFDATMQVYYGTGIFLNLREGTTNLARTKLRRGYATTGTTSGDQASITATWRIGGLTPSSVHTYKVGFGKIASNGSTPTIIQVGGETDGGSWGPMVTAVSSSPL